jgi:excisionase family DNA binding protein
MMLNSGYESHAAKRHQVKRAEPLLRVHDVAKLLNMSTVTVRRRVRDGTLPHFRIRGQIYFKLSEINAFIEANRGGTSSAPLLW